MIPQAFIHTSQYRHDKSVHTMCMHKDCVEWCTAVCIEQLQVQTIQLMKH
jgi:hypothetical protein